jgi:uncharacterized protein
MKFSQFNSFIPYDGQIIAYNAYSDNYLLLDPVLYELIVSAKAYNIADLDEIHPSFYSALVDSGFIINDDDNEIEKVRSLIAEVDGNENSYRLIINPTMNCNFKCWYCYETHIKDSKMDKDTIEKVTKLIDNIVNSQPNLKAFYLSFFGGEPLLYNDKVVVPILEAANKIIGEKDIYLEADFTTNGYLINDKMIAQFKQLRVRNFQITLDGNREHHDTVRFVSKQRGSYNEIIENIKLLATEGFLVTLRINYTQHNIDGVDEILLDFLELPDDIKRNINISLHQVWQDGNRSLGAKVNHFMDNVRTMGFSTTHSVLADTVRNSCYADHKNHATVNYNGEVFKCTARDFSTNNSEGLLDDSGNIIWNEKYYNRMSSKLKNKPCLECAILPICGGGCSQQAIENENGEYCVNFFDENRKKNIVLERFLSTFVANIV